MGRETGLRNEETLRTYPGAHIGVFFFFFQAEDGIRDLTVTGVQTCALPIYIARARIEHRARAETGERRAPSRRWIDDNRLDSAPLERQEGARTNRTCAVNRDRKSVV